MLYIFQKPFAYFIQFYHHFVNQENILILHIQQMKYEMNDLLRWKPERVVNVYIPISSSFSVYSESNEGERTYSLVLRSALRFAHQMCY